MIHTMRRTPGAKIVVIFRVGNIGIVIIVTIWLLVVYR